MPRKEPMKLPSTDPSPGDGAEMSEAERRRHARQEARRRAKEQKRQLARIRKESMGPTSKTVAIWAVVLITLLAVIGFGGYKFWVFYSINLHRKSFMDEYNVADLSTLRRFAPAELSQVEEKKRLAEAAAESGGRARAVAEHYRAASRLLHQALAEARNTETRYGEISAELARLEADARERHLHEFAPTLWEQIQDRAETGRDIDSSSFTAKGGIDDLEDAIEMLRNAARSYEDLAAFGEAFGAFRDLEERYIEDELRQNLPDELASVETVLTRARQAEQLQQWATAARHYRRVNELLGPALERVGERREAARAAAEAFFERLDGVQEAGLPQKDPAAWEELHTGRAQVAEALEAYRYAQVQERIGALLTVLAAAEQRVHSAAIARRQRLAELEEALNSARQAAAFFETSFPDRWGELLRAYEAFLERARDEDVENAALLEEADRLQGLVDGLVAERARVLENLAGAQQAIRTLEADPLAEHVALNFPALGERLFLAGRSAQRALQQRKVAEAMRHLQTQATVLREAVDKLRALRRESQTLARECAEKRQRFAHGIAAFRARRMRAYEGVSQQASALFEAHRYLDAAPLFRQMAELLPAERFTVDTDGAVCDNVTGLMWAAAADGAGANRGQPLSWYEARRWVHGLTLGGFRDWRLPTEEELREIGRLPADLRRRVLPGLETGVYWSDVASTVNVEEAIAVDLDSARLARVPKRRPMPVRAVRSP